MLLTSQIGESELAPTFCFPAPDDFLHTSSSAISWATEQHASPSEAFQLYLPPVPFGSNASLTARPDRILSNRAFAPGVYLGLDLLHPDDYWNLKGTEWFNYRQRPVTDIYELWVILVSPIFTSLQTHTSLFHDENNFNQFCFWTPWWQPKYQKLSENYQSYYCFNCFALIGTLG